jgi:hypothetical protein
MPLTARYAPEKPPAEVRAFGYDFSPLIPIGVDLLSGSLAIFTNTVAPVAADGDWTKKPVYTRGRAVYAVLAGGTLGKDYQLVWTATDGRGNVWSRTALCLVSQTS